MSPVTGLEQLQQYRASIEAALDAFFEDSLELLGIEQSRHGLQALHRLQSYCLRPAKRLRGSLAAYTYDMQSETVKDEVAIRLGVVLELMQGYLLIVDDAMDRSSLRRGEATLHELYKADGVDEHEADMIAINTGLLAQHLASLELARLPVSPEALVDATRVMQRNIALTGLGQLDDITSAHKSDTTEGDILHKYVQKSSYYTFVNPLQLGFALAGNNAEETMKICESYGVAAGIAFQLHDDDLGMFGDEAALGKSTLDDLREGKHTLLVQHAYAHATPEQSAVLEKLLGNTEATTKDLEAVQQILVSIGSREYCRQQAKEYARTAVEALGDSEFGSAEFRQNLAAIVEYSIERDT